jgi:RNA polymerase sigma-70 factor (ECF subfamily)
VRIPPTDKLPHDARSPDDATLVDRMIHGDRGAAAMLVGRYFRAAFAVALAVTRNRADAEDVAQEAFVVAIGRIEECREPGKFAGWLMTIVRNRSKNMRDSFQVRRSVPWNEDAVSGLFAHDPASDVGRRETADRLLLALSGINETPREVVLLHDLQGWSHAEIADVLGISEVMSRQHLFVAHRALRDRLGDVTGRGGFDG